MFKRVWPPITPVIKLSVLLAYSFASHFACADPNALWKISHDQCIPHQETSGLPAPCAEVDESQGFVILKDIVGPLQYLLIPTKKIAGMESSELLDPETPNYFAEAWQARRFMSKTLGSAINDRTVALAINAESARSQNQLHIHISCIRSDVRRQIDADAAHITTQWQKLPTSLNGVRFSARRIARSTLENISPFRLLAQSVDGAVQDMGDYGIAMLALDQNDFVMLIAKSKNSLFAFKSAEAVQDHNCAILPTALHTAH